MALYDNTLDGELLAHVGYGQLREQDHVLGLALTFDQQSHSSHNGILSSYPNEAIYEWKLSHLSASKQGRMVGNMIWHGEALFGAFRKERACTVNGIRPERARIAGKNFVL